MNKTFADGLIHCTRQRGIEFAIEKLAEVAGGDRRATKEAVDVFFSAIVGSAYAIRRRIAKGEKRALWNKGQRLLTEAAAAVGPAATVAVAAPAPAYRSGPAESEFPRRETLVKLDELVARRADLTAKRESAQRRLNLAVTERGALEALGNDPSAVIRERRREVEVIEHELELLRADINETCQKESARFAQIKNQLWASCRAEFVLPTS